ncbi:hypothetical protein TPA0909_19920 [Streptomyces albus]|nr:hypothetical protein TPA0909_19920 [Streptomyces albus]
MTFRAGGPAHPSETAQYGLSVRRYAEHAPTGFPSGSAESATEFGRSPGHSRAIPSQREGEESMDEDNGSGGVPPQDGRRWCVGALAALAAVGHIADLAQIVELVERVTQHL